MNILIKYFVVSSIISLSSLVFAEHVVIVHPNNSAEISKKDVEKMFLAKTKTFPNGQLAMPINLPEGSESRTTFDKEVLGKTPQQVKSYWARLVFTGEASPLKVVDNHSEVVELVAKNESIIGYIDRASVTDAVKVISSF